MASVTNHLLNNVGAEFLNRKGADIADKLTNNCVAEATVVKIKNVLHHLEAKHQTKNPWSFIFATHIVAVRILNER